MHISDLIKKVISVAPIIGGLLGGPAFSIPLAMLANAFGTSSKPEDILAKMQVDPEMEIKLKQLDLQLSQVDLQALEASYQDIQNARDSSLSKIKITGHEDWMVHLLSFMLTLGFFGSFYFAFNQLHIADKALLSYLMGVLTSRFMAMCSYYYGSSHSSRIINKT